ncbi:alpha-glucosidase 2-like protein [Trifolium pratense]|uniref:Alpha-glucosidase 2-like protein n=1 Tax=Trifolium pratense TaxID=57577 RepID=A0A2K3JQI9_TRIPR|nr:alpha-glucosidase 2-like protein [Trifolium pratense]
MANYEGQVTSGSSDVRKGNMIFEAILDDGVFRFDCSVDDRDAAYPSVSFVNSKDRETPITSTHKDPLYNPTFECLLEQQVVQLEVSCLLSTFDWYLINVGYLLAKAAFNF